MTSNRESLDILRVHEIAGVFIICRVEDSHEIQRTGAEQKLFRNQMLYIIQLLLTYDGDIARYCGRGRSRSPAIIAAYLVVIEGFSAKGHIHICQQNYCDCVMMIKE